MAQALADRALSALGKLLRAQAVADLALSALGKLLRAHSACRLGAQNKASSMSKTMQSATARPGKGQRDELVQRLLALLGQVARVEPESYRLRGEQPLETYMTELAEHYADSLLAIAAESGCVCRLVLHGRQDPRISPRYAAAPDEPCGRFFLLLSGHNAEHARPRSACSSACSASATDHYAELQLPRGWQVSYDSYMELAFRPPRQD